MSCLYCIVYCLCYAVLNASIFELQCALPSAWHKGSYKPTHSRMVPLTGCMLPKTHVKLYLLTYSVLTEGPFWSAVQDKIRFLADLRKGVQSRLMPWLMPWKRVCQEA